MVAETIPQITDTIPRITETIAQIEETFNEEVMKDIAEWIEKL